MAGMSQKNNLEQLKNELIGKIEHEIRTPLSIIKESLSLIAEEIPGQLNPQQKKLLFIAKKNIDRLVSSLEEMLKNPWNKTGGS